MIPVSWKHVCLGLVTLFFPLIQSFSQSLPLEMRMSSDGRRLITGGNPSTGFYDGNVIQEIELTFSQTNYWSLLTTNYTAGIDIPAKMAVNGYTLPSPVGVRFKGQTSYQRLPANSQKKSFNITVDFENPDQNIFGYETLNLNNAYEDPSFMREVVYLHHGRNHIPSLKGNYVRLRINGEDWGLYANIQGLNAEFLEEWFLSNDGTRWRAMRTTGGAPGGGNPFGAGLSSLNYLGPDTNEYKKNYTLKTANKANPWDDLVKTCAVLNNTSSALLYDSLRHYLDIDRALWTLATEIVFLDDDSYVNKGGMDYYLYWEPETGRLVNMEYDGNSAMKLNNVNWSPFYNSTNVNFALLNKLLNLPELRQRYLAHLRTLVAENLNQAAFDAVVDKYAALITPVVQSDTKKIYTFAQYQSDVQSLKNFATQRRNILMANVEVNVQGLNISNLSYTAGGTTFGKPAEGEKVYVTTRVQGTAGVKRVNLYYGTGYLGKFERVQMLDDGMNQDGTAGDGVFGAAIPGHTKGTVVRYYVEAIANNSASTATYFPAGAEHDVFVYQVKLADYFESPVVINELMASNTKTVADQDGEFDDWIELYNKSATTVDLSGWTLSDDVNKLTKWAFPPGTSIAPNGYLIVWADENGKQAGLHANFKLSATGESLYLLDPSVRIAQEVHFGPQQADMGYARMPNGTGDFVIQKPTFNDNNGKAVNTHELPGIEVSFRIYPNPVSNEVFVRSSKEDVQTVRLLNLYGQELNRQIFTVETSFDTRNLQPGLYFIEIDRQVQKLVKK